MSIFGDVKQCIYTYMDSDSRYLTFMNKIINREWLHLELTYSFRINKQICMFINECMYKKEIIKSNI